MTWVYCSVHGSLDEAPACLLGEIAQRRWEKTEKPEGEKLVIIAVDDRNWDHAAACAAPGDETWREAVHAELKSAIEYAKVLGSGLL